MSEVKLKKMSEHLSRGPKRSYDAAATQATHFQYATNADADTLIYADLATLRNRVRYEVRNNCYAKGISVTKADDLVGTGPQLYIESDNPKIADEIENKFREWAQSCDLTGKKSLSRLIRLCGSLQQDESGEAFIVMVNDNKPSNSWPRSTSPIRLKLLAVEPDRIETPLDKLRGLDETLREGIEYDSLGRPKTYYVLKHHPGSFYGYKMNDYDVIPANSMIHLYHEERPGQSRGVPRLTPAIPLLAQLRRFTLACVDSAETLASIAGALQKKDAYGDTESWDPLDEIDIPRNSWLTLPEGYTLGQIKSEQPPTTYKEFKHELLNEIARCLCMPFNVAALNSSGYNYASGRLDWQVYHRMIRTERQWLEDNALNRIFFAWLTEASLIPGYLSRKPKIANPCWYWPGSEHVDPVKEAVAQKQRMSNLVTTLADECAYMGKDWRRQIKQRAIELEEIKKAGIVAEEPTAIINAKDED